jgi:hypothetical protein
MAVDITLILKEKKMTEKELKHPRSCFGHYKCHLMDTEYPYIPYNCEYCRIADACMQWWQEEAEAKKRPVKNDVAYAASAELRESLVKEKMQLLDELSTVESKLGMVKAVFMNFEGEISEIKQVKEIMLDGLQLIESEVIDSDDDEKYIKAKSALKNTEALLVNLENMSATCMVVTDAYEKREAELNRLISHLDEQINKVDLHILGLRMEE